MRKITFAVALLGLVACGGTKTVYVVNTDAPETTEKVVTTTKAPAVIATPAPTQPMATWTEEDEFLFDVEQNYYGTIYVSDYEMIETGRIVCSSLLAGASGEEVALAIVGAGGDTAFISTVVASAVANFCPSQAWKFQNL